MAPPVVRNTVGEKTRGHFNDMYAQITGKNIQEVSDSELLSQIHASSIAAPSLTSKPPKASSSKKKSISNVEKTPDIELLKNNIFNTDEEDRGWFGDITHNLTHPTDLLKSAGHGFMNALDELDRYRRTGTSALYEVQKSINDGEPFWSLGDDLLWGAGQGASNQRRVGFGDVIELQSKYDSEGKGWGNRVADFLSPSPLGPVFGPLEREAHRTATKQNPDSAYVNWRNVAFGAVGDIALDPTTYFTGGVTTVSKGHKAANAAAKAYTAETGIQLIRKSSKQVMQEEAERIGREVLKDSTLNASKISVPAVRDAAGRIVSNKTISRVDNVIAKMQESLDNLIFDISSGAHKGNTIGSFRETGTTFASHLSEGHKAAQLAQLRPVLSRFESTLRLGKTWSPSKLATEFKNHPLFKTFYDDFLKNAGTNEARLKKAGALIEDILTDEAATIFAASHHAFQNAVMKIPTLRLMGKEIAEFPELGRLLNKVAKSKVGQTTHNLKKVFSYADKFPGYSSLIAMKTRALGNRAFQSFRKKTVLVAKDLTREERLAVGKAIDDKVVEMVGAQAHLEPARQFLVAENAKMRLEEIAAGVRKASEPAADNYQYIYLKTRKKELRDDFVTKRKNAINKNRTTTGYTVADAKAKGLRPVEDPFVNIILRKAKSNRRLTRVWFGKDLATHFGFKSDSFSNEVEKGFVKITNHKMLDKSFKYGLKEGEDLYLDKEIMKVWDNFESLSTVGSADGEAYLRLFDSVTRKIKTMNTIWWPGFHIRNFMSDFYMGWIDGVRKSDYWAVIKNWDKATADINMGGQTVSLAKMINSFDELKDLGTKLPGNAQLPLDALAESFPTSGGMISTELGVTTSRHLGDEKLRNVFRHPTTANTAVKVISEKREDFGRLVHFYHAMTEEYPALLRRGYSKEKAWEHAANASIFRVNKFKFDYGALTRVEQRALRRVIPFYTYMRKAIPTLIESLYLSPRVLTNTNKLFTSMHPEGEDMFDGPQIPGYLLDQGFLQLTGGEEPWGLSGQFLPQDVFSNALENPLANVNPLIRGPIELLLTKKDTFTEKPTNTPLDWVKNNTRVVSTWRKVTGPADAKEIVASVLGIPFIEISKKRQESAVKNDMYQFKAKIKGIDAEYKITGMHIYLGSNNQIKVKDLLTGEIKEFATLEEAQKYLLPYRNREVRRNNEEQED